MNRDSQDVRLQCTKGQPEGGTRRRQIVETAYPQVVLSYAMGSGHIKSLSDAKLAINIKRKRHGCEANIEVACTRLANEIKPQKINASCAPKISGEWRG